ncbi:hypothetical protein BDV96DRAFT_16670 [Lophiotrema nucula]|uniref:Uncharacterized protein n=1 Tax=Lophiotrema nucula TaxID=690887 RepID=A0A6A5ZDK0_9PLEO|nr:hypothetical protein BDV96DRAFT_16670 [Lophiotrema nucula]
MEVIATIGVISSVVQLVDFSSRCLAKGVQLYQSTSGVLDENEAIGTALEHLVSLKDVVLNATASDADSALKELCQAVTGAALELAEALEKVKVKKAPGEAARWRSMRKAIRSVWSKEKIRELEHRLEGLRLELSLHITFKTR